MKKNKIKSAKVPFYFKPFQKVLEQSTDLTLSYLYDYCVKFYNEKMSYNDWLFSVKEFMSKFNKECEF